MGLDTSHGCWHGPYSSFNNFRIAVAAAIRLPLQLMQGHYRPFDDTYPQGGVPWELLKPDPLHILLDHSDCDGEIAVGDCLPLADRLEEIIPLLPEDSPLGLQFRAAAKRFAAGLRMASMQGEPVEFH